MIDKLLQQPVRVLLVEDDRDSGDSLRLMLEKRGLLVVWVRTAEEALVEWSGGIFDVIVADIRLGGMNGVELLQHIHEKSPDFPFILLTGYDSLETAIRAVRFGANDYLLKPLDEIETLLRPLERAVRLYRLQLHSMAVEQDLKESERRLSTLMSNLAGMVYRCLHDDRRTMEFVSEGSRALLECEPAEILGAQGIAYPSLIHAGDRNHVRDEIGKAIAARMPFRLEYGIVTRGGQEKWVWEQGRFISGGERSPGMIEGLIEDITDRKLAEEHIRRLNMELDQRVKERTSQLEAANHEIEAFSYAVSHDLRAPLRSIDGFSDMLLQDFGDRVGEQGRSDIERIRSAVKKMAGLIDALLQLSRLSHRELKRERVDLSRMAAEIVAELKAADSKCDADFVVAAEAAADGDPDMIRIVLQNLLNNARKFTRKKPDARIEFGIANSADSTLGIPKSEIGKTVFFVRDNGAGFDMAYEAKLFGAFQRLHSQSEFEGYGIGLATVQRILRRHDGAIWAVGEVGKGATFYFTL